MSYTKSREGSILKNALLLKKYHTNLVYDYTEYPTKGNWSEKFDSESYKSAIADWFGKDKNKKSPSYFMFTHLFVSNFVIFVYAAKQ